MQHYLKTKGIVLRSRLGKEADTEITLYTQDLGRLEARLTSAKKGNARLAPLAELFSEADYHLYLRPGALYAKVIGGTPGKSFLGGSFAMEHFQVMARICELVDVLTPHQQLNVHKYHLLSESLDVARRQPVPIVPIAFALKLLHLAGFGIESKEDYPLLEFLIQVPWDAIRQLPLADEDTARYDKLLTQHIQDIIHRPLKTKIFEQKMGAALFS